MTSDYEPISVDKRTWRILLEERDHFLLALQNIARLNGNTTCSEAQKIALEALKKSNS